MRVVEVTSLKGLGSHAAAWDRLAFCSPQRLPMLSHAWISTYLEYYLTPGIPWVCLFAYNDDSELVGVLPVVIESCRVMGTRCARLRLNLLENADMVIAEGLERPVIATLLSALEKNSPNWFCLEFDELPEESATMKYVECIQKAGFCVDGPAGKGSFIKIQGTYPEFLNSLSPHFARNLRRVGRKIDQQCEVQMLFLGSETPEEHLRRFMKVEASGWKGQMGNAIQRSARSMAYYEVLVRRLAEKGWLEWHFLVADGKTLAGHMGIKMGRSLVLYKIAYDEAYSAFAPGNVLMASTIERAFNSGDTDEINCLTDYPWNRNWQMLLRPYRNLRVYRHSFLPLTCGYLPGKARKAVREVRGVRPLLGTIRRQFLDRSA